MVRHIPAPVYGPLLAPPGNGIGPRNPIPPGINVEWVDVAQRLEQTVTRTERAPSPQPQNIVGAEGKLAANKTPQQQQQQQQQLKLRASRMSGEPLAGKRRQGRAPPRGLHYTGTWCKELVQLKNCHGETETKEQEKTKHSRGATKSGTKRPPGRRGGRRRSRRGQGRGRSTNPAAEAAEQAAAGRAAGTAVPGTAAPEGQGRAQGAAGRGRGRQEPPPGNA